MTDMDRAGGVERAARALLERRDERLQCEAALEDIDNPEVRGHATACWTSMLSREENAASALRAALSREPREEGPTDYDAKLAQFDDDPRILPVAAEVRRVRAIWPRLRALLRPV